MADQWESVSSSSEWEPVDTGWEPVATEKKPSALQKLAQIITKPGRMERSAFTLAQQLASVPFAEDKMSALGQATERARQAGETGYQPQGIGEKSAAFASQFFDPVALGLGLGVGKVIGAVAPTLAEGGLAKLAVKGAAEGALASGAQSALEQKAENDAVNLGDVAKSAAVGGAFGAVIEPASAKVGDLLASRSLKKAAEAEKAQAIKASAAETAQLQERLTNAQSLRNILERKKDALEAPTQARISEIEARIKQLEEQAIPAARVAERQARDGEIATARARINQLREARKSQFRDGVAVAPDEVRRLDKLIDQEQARIANITRSVPENQQALASKVSGEKLTKEDVVYRNAADRFDKSPEGQRLEEISTILRERKGPSFEENKPLQDELLALRDHRTQSIIEDARKEGVTLTEEGVKTMRQAEFERRLERASWDNPGMMSEAELAAKREAAALRDEMRMRYRMLSAIENSPTGRAYKQAQGRQSELMTRLRGENAIKNEPGAPLPPLPTSEQYPGMVKVLFKQDGRTPESMWVKVTGRDSSGKITGILDNKPVGLDLKLGQSVAFLPSEVVNRPKLTAEHGLPAGGVMAQRASKVTPEGQIPAKSGVPDKPMPVASALVEDAAAMPIQKPDGAVDPVPVMARVVKSEQELSAKFSKALGEGKPEAVLGMYEYASGRKKMSRIVAQFVRDEGEAGKAIVMKMFGDEPAYKAIEHLPANEFAKTVEQTATQAGRVLQVYSALAQKTQKAIESIVDGSDKALAETFYKVLNQKTDKPLSRIINPVGAFSRDIINAWRGYLVSAYGTASRNIFTQGARYSIGMVDQLLNGSVQYGRHLTGARNGAPASEAFAGLTENWMSMLQMLSSPKYRKQVYQMVESLKPLGTERLAHSMLSDVELTANTKLGKPLLWSARMLNEKVFGNLIQERFYQNLSFDARFRTTLKRAGFDINNLDAIPKDTLEQFVQDATEHALTMTFAANPAKGSAGAAVLNLYQKVPILNVLSTPFPRFWYNATRFTMEYSPIGFMFANAGKGNPEMAANGIAKTMTGSLMWGAALAIRNTKYAGAKWYQIVPRPESHPDEVIDVRAFAPLATMLFMAEMANRVADKANGARLDIGMPAEEVANALFALRRSDFSGLPFLDNTIFNKTEMGESAPKMMETVEKMMGDFIGGFTVPIKSFREIVNGLEPINIKSNQQAPLTSPAIGNIPGLRERLPDEPSLARDEPKKTYYPALRGLGIAINKESPFQREMSRHDISQSELSARLGHPDLDDAATARMGQLLSKIMNPLVESPQYQALPRDRQKFLIEQFIKKIRPDAVKVGKLDEAALSIPLDIQNRINSKVPLRERLMVKEQIKALIEKAEKSRKFGVRAYDKELLP